MTDARPPHERGFNRSVTCHVEASMGACNHYRRQVHHSGSSPERAVSGCGRLTAWRTAGAVVSPLLPTSRFGPTSYSSVAHRATTRCLATLSTRHRRRWPMTGRLPRGNRRSPIPAYPGTTTWDAEETLASRGSNPRRRTEYRSQNTVRPFAPSGARPNLLQ
jgi:hypothetical protein